MPLTVEAVYENGVLKPTQQPPLKEHQRVQITIAAKTNWVQETYDICGWKGSPEEGERFATDPELDFPPPADGAAAEPTTCLTAEDRGGPFLCFLCAPRGEGSESLRGLALPISLSIALRTGATLDLVG